MIKYQINGKTIFLTTEQYLNLTDDDLQEIIAKNSGVYINDPFYDIRETRKAEGWDEFEQPETDIESKKYYIPDVDSIEVLPKEEIDKLRKDFEEEF